MIIPIVRRYWASHSAYLWQRDVYHHVTWSTSLWRLGWFRWRWIEIVRRSRHVERNLYRRPDVCYMSKIYIIQYGSPGRPETWQQVQDLLHSSCWAFSGWCPPALAAALTVSMGPAMCIRRTQDVRVNCSLQDMTAQITEKIQHLNYLQVGPKCIW